MGDGQVGPRGQLASQCVDQVIDNGKGSVGNPTLGMGDTSVSAHPIKIIIVLEGNATKQVLTLLYNLLCIDALVHWPIYLNLKNQYNL